MNETRIRWGSWRVVDVSRCWNPVFDGHHPPTSAAMSESRIGNKASRANWNRALGWTSCTNACAAVEHGNENALVNRWPTDARTWTGSEERGLYCDGGVVNFVVIADCEEYDCIPGQGNEEVDGGRRCKRRARSQIDSSNLIPRYISASSRFYDCERVRSKFGWDYIFSTVYSRR